MLTEKQKDYRITIQISKRLVLINSASSVITWILQASVLIWLQQYLLRRISADEYSLLPVLSAIMVFTPLVTTILTSGLERYIVEAYAKQNEQRITQIVSTLFPILLCVASIIFTCGLAFAWNIEHILSISQRYVTEAKIMLALMIFVFAVELPLAPFRAGFSVRQKFVFRNLIRLGGQLLGIILLFVLLFGVSTRVLWVVVATRFALLCQTLIIVVISRRYVPTLRFELSEFHWPLAKELTAFGGWRFIGHIGGIIHKAAGPLILNKLATPVDITAFHVGSIVDRNFRSFMLDVFESSQPALTAMHADNSHDRLAKAYLRGGRFSLWIAMLVAVPLIIFAKDVFQLYLQEKYSMYVASATVMTLLLALYPLVYARNLLGRITIAMACIRPMMLILLTGELINLGLAVYLVGVKHMGAIGPALSTFLVAATMNIAGFWPLGLRLMNIRFAEFARNTVLPGLLPGMIGAITWIVLRFVFYPANWIELLVCMGLGTIIYATVLFGFCLQPDDRKDLITLKNSICSPHQDKIS